jgi:hypothetical protein
MPAIFLERSPFSPRENVQGKLDTTSHRVYLKDIALCYSSCDVIVIYNRAPFEMSYERSAPFTMSLEIGTFYRAKTLDAILQRQFFNATTPHM